MPGKLVGPHYDERFRRTVYEDYLAADLPRGYFELWAEQKAKDIGVSKATVRNWIAKYKEAERDDFGGAGTPAQAIAGLVGATIGEAVLTLKRNLKAHNVKLVTDREGNVLHREFTPNAEAQNSAAEKLLKIWGAFAPDKLAVDVRRADDPATWSEEKLREELERLRATTPALPNGENTDAENTKHDGE